MRHRRSLCRRTDSVLHVTGEIRIRIYFYLLIDLLAEIETSLITAQIRIDNNTLLIAVRERSRIFHLVATTVQSHIVIVADGCTVDFILPVIISKSFVIFQSDAILQIIIGEVVCRHDFLL